MEAMLHSKSSYQSVNALQYILTYHEDFGPGIESINDDIPLHRGTDFDSSITTTLGVAEQVQSPSLMALVKGSNSGSSPLLYLESGLLLLHASHVITHTASKLTLQICNELQSLFHKDFLILNAPPYSHVIRKFVGRFGSFTLPSAILLKFFAVGSSGSLVACNKDEKCRKEEESFRLLEDYEANRSPAVVNSAHLQASTNDRLSNYEGTIQVFLVSHMLQGLQITNAHHNYDIIYQLTMINKLSRSTFEGAYAHEAEQNLQ